MSETLPRRQTPVYGLFIDPLGKAVRFVSGRLVDKCPYRETCERFLVRDEDGDGHWCVVVCNAVPTAWVSHSEVAKELWAALKEWWPTGRLAWTDGVQLSLQIDLGSLFAEDTAVAQLMALPDPCNAPLL